MKVFVTGTDTDVGKTLVSCVLTAFLEATYWKPVQAGIDPTTDRQSLADWCPPERLLPERFCLKAPMSPNQAARREDRVLRLSDFQLPDVKGPLIVEGAGGLMVPLNQEHMIVDLIGHLGLPALLVARSGLGTLNHTLLSLAELRRRDIPCVGLVLVGPEHPDNVADLRHFGQVPVLGRIPLRVPFWGPADLPELKSLLDLSPVTDLG
ncbi:dethiobiotin synthase [Acanthopleuribacter pedis]|uniref:ATP-dependent dethiobiotin synthetase BioD n=1 Tax=Acanthopleuribacter pedis TaxID=442870 RepID=A0A8J7U2X4_9BACT|nr:dethiobiotin synthase [Acanthopleuribacter pedis]MBO1318194.1 dethiobiotin synthase [Acanthopleuribacter pedis]